MTRNFRLNDQIVAPNVRLIDQDGESIGVVARDQALYLAFQHGLDLVEVGPGANPPVAKIIDRGKFLYQLQKKEQKQKSNTKQGEVKQIRLGVHIAEHDLAVKAKRGQEFLKAGHKIRVSIVLRGRERALSSRAIEMIKKFEDMVEGALEAPPRTLGNMVFGVITKKLAAKP